MFSVGAESKNKLREVLFALSFTGIRSAPV